MNWSPQPLVMFLLALILCPLMTGVVNRVKARFGGRRGPPLLQPYYDLHKLARKDLVYSHTATWLFRACPTAVLAAGLMAVILTPMSNGGALVAFPGDFVVWAGAFTLARIFMVLAALDVGSSFEGMGGSREAWFAALAEPALLLALASLAFLSGELSLTGFFRGITMETWSANLAAALFAALAIFIVTLAENARIPVDDPATHLELTMIHEVMVLDHSGPDFAIITYGSSLKLWAMGALTVGTALPTGLAATWVVPCVFLAGMLVFAVVVGAVESCMARLRLLRVPQFLVGASVFAALSLIMAARSFHGAA